MSETKETTKAKKVSVKTRKELVDEWVKAEELCKEALLRYNLIFEDLKLRKRALVLEELPRNYKDNTVFYVVADNGKALECSKSGTTYEVNFKRGE